MGEWKKDERFEMDTQEYLYIDRQKRINKRDEKMHINGEPKCYNITEVKEELQGPRIVINNEYGRKIGKMGAKQRAMYFISVSSTDKTFPLKV